MNPVVVFVKTDVQYPSKRDSYYCLCYSIVFDVNSVRIIGRYENDCVYFSEVFNNPSVMLMYKHQVHGINNIQYSR